MTCGGWHLELGGAHAVVVDGTDALLTVADVLAASERMDTVVLRVSGGPLVPLALSPTAKVGDAAHGLSDPLRQTGYFSAGIVDRLHHAGGDGAARMNVSADRGPGSSGAAVLDAIPARSVLSLLGR